MANFAISPQDLSIGTGQRLCARWLSVLLVATGVALTPYANQAWLPLPGYMTAFGAAMLAINFMLAMLLYNRGATEGSGTVVMLGTAYFFVATILLPLMASFPGGMIQGSIIGTPVSSVWLWSFWHAGFGLLILRYFYATRRRHEHQARSSLREAGMTVALVTMLAVIATAGLPYLPSLFADGHRFFSGMAQVIPWTILAIDAFAAAQLILLPKKTPEQLWLSVGMLAACFDVWLTFHGTDRFSLGWYVSKLGSLFTSIAVLMSLFSDLTMLYRRAAENAYFLRAITENIPALIAYIDKDQIVRYSNQAYDMLMGVDHRKMPGKTMHAVLGDESYAQIQPHVERVLSGQRVKFERESQVAGHAVHFLCEYIPDLAPDRTVRGFHAMVMNISERKNAELSQARSEQLAEAASRAKSEFVANMSHEIRTPMNAVLGITQLLERTQLSAEQSKYLQMIRHSGSALLTIINDILDFSKIEAGKLDIVAAPFQLNDVIVTLASVMTINVGVKKIELAIGVAPDVPQALSGDAMRLQQALINLIGNALKFTEHGEVTVRVSVSEVREAETVLRFDVRDTGIGLSPEQLSRLFVQFEQADTTTSRRFGGTGLGLIISRRLIELMGGTIAVTSTAGQGSQFSIIVPFQVQDQQKPATEIVATRLLIVDRNASTRQCVSDTAHGLGWQVASAADPRQALALCKGSELRGPALLLIDHTLRESDDFFALRDYVNQHDIALAVMGTMADRDGVADMLLKPITASALRDLARRILNQREAASTPEAVFVAAMQQTGMIGASILLVEDNETNVIVAQGLLEPLGVKIVVAENGAIAVEQLRAAPGRFDLVLMDVQMPVMDGYTATDIIRRELGLKLPVLAMTAGVLESERASCLAAGMNDIIPKPIDFEQASTLIARYLNQ